MSCLCQRCGKDYTADILVPDEIWEVIKPSNKPKGAGLLCGFCIITSLESQGYAAYQLVEI